MKPALPLLAACALPALAAEVPALRLAEATPPDWRGERGLVFAADRATLAFEGGGSSPAAKMRRAPDAPFAPVRLAPDPATPSRWLLDLPETGWYDLRLSLSEDADLQPRSGDLQARSADLQPRSGDFILTAAVVGAPIPEAWRTNSVFGLWNVHGDPALIRLAGARWNRRMTAFHSVTPEQAAEFGDLDSSHSSLVTRHSSRAAGGGAVPYDERDGLRQVGVFSFGLPPWTMAIPEGVKMPSFGSLFYPATNWNDVARCVAAYARTHALPRDFSIYNEPLAHFKGKPAQLADYARAVRAGLKAADPSFRVGGPGLYSIRIRDLTAIEEGGLLESLDFLDLHAYVGGTPPEGEFVRKIEMLRDWLAAHGRPDMPVYLTEFGWTAAAGTWQPPVDRAAQARYVARSLALAWSEGMDALVYFALDFRTKKAGEAAFSLIDADGRPEAGYAAFAAVSRHFAASEPIGRFRLAPGVHLVAGRRDGRLQLMAWAEEGTPPRALRLPFPIASARDGLGAPVRGTLPPLGPSPLFLETEPLPAAQLRLPTLPVRAVARLPKPSKGAFWAVDPGDDPPDGTYAMFLPRVGGGWGVQPCELRSPATIEETRLAWPADSVKPVLEVVVRSHETNGTLAATLSLGNGVSTDLSLAPGATETVRWPLSGMHRWSGRRNRAAIRLSLPDGSVRERTAEWTVLPVLDAADADHPPLLVAPWAYFTDWEPFGVKAQPLVTRPSPLVAGGKATVPDCGDGRVRLLHDAEALTVEVEVRDDEHAPSSDPSRLWSADSIQLGFDLDWAKPWEAGFAGAGSSQTLGGHRVFEWSVGGDGRGPAVAYRERSWDDALPVGICAAVEARVERDEAAARTRYRVRFPWAELGAAARPPRPGEAIGFSLAVNDVDPARGAPRHGLTLFGGIVDDKEPKRFGPAWLRPPLSPSPQP